MIAKISINYILPVIAQTLSPSLFSNIYTYKPIHISYASPRLFFAILHHPPKPGTFLNILHSLYFYTLISSFLSFCNTHHFLFTLKYSLLPCIPQWRVPLVIQRCYPATTVTLPSETHHFFFIRTCRTLGLPRYLHIQTEGRPIRAYCYT
jgi:hypothetical protein